MHLFALSLDWMNYPGLELWKFINLAIFLSVAIFILRRPLSGALQARRETIRQEIIKAREERDIAVRKLEEADEQLAHADADVTKIREQARQEAVLERERLAVSGEREIEKLHTQAQREVEMARRVTRKTLREFLAQRSVQLAKESVRSRMSPEDDVRLINASIGELRRSRG